MEQKLVLEASAGSGKTFALSIRYISLLVLGSKPESILTLTFTNKAANEMLERITLLLKELKYRELELLEISKLTGITKDEILKRQPYIYRSFLKANLNISTIDKFNTLILRNFSLYRALMPDFKVGEGVDEHRFFTIFIHNIIKKGLYSALVDFAMYEQKRLHEIFGFLKVLNQKRPDLANIKISSLSREDSKKEVMAIFLSIKNIFLSFDNLSPSGKKALLCSTPEDILDKSWIEKSSILDYQYFKKFHHPKLQELFLRLKEVLNRYLIAKEAYYKVRYLKIFEVYKDVKTKLNLETNKLEFDDITNFVYELLQQGEVDSEFLYFRLDSKIDHILIDEFQDTNVAQYKILEPLIDEICAGFGVKADRSFFYVGDIKQSIYRFRGGVKELFFYVKDRFDVKLEKLTTNYRSSKEVVEFVNRVFEPKIKGYSPQIAYNKDQDGYIKVVTSSDLLKSVIDEVFELLNSGVRPDDIALLCYSNDDTYLIKDELLKEDSSLLVTTTTTKKLIDISEVKAVIEFLKFLYFKERVYLTNFLSLIGRHRDKDIELKKFCIDRELNTLIKDIIIYFGLFYYDENLLKLLEISREYRDIDEFIYDSENIETLSPNKEDKGIKILTIHKSKGLEFKHVVVIDRFKKRPANRDSMLFYYQGINLVDMYIKFKNRQLVDGEFKVACERVKELEIEDELNTLYVALTRAELSLIVCQKDKDSSLALLGLEDYESGRLVVEKIAKETILYEEFDYRAVKTGSQDRAKSISSDISDINSINFGLALHYLLESLPDFKSKHINSAYWAMKNRYEMRLLDGQAQQIKKRVELLLKDKAFLSLVKGEIYKEVPLVYNQEVKQLDLVIEQDGKLIVVDYKSSSSLQQSHIKQVKEYKKALQSIYHSKEIEGYICYLRRDEVDLLEVV
jgi:exodeoxyribonuclease V beta subunit